MPSSNELKRQNELLKDQQDILAGVQSAINNAAGAAGRLSSALQGAVNYAKQIDSDMMGVSQSTAEASQHANTLGSNLSAAMQSGMQGLKNFGNSLKGQLAGVGTQTMQSITETFGNIGSIVQNTMTFAIPAALAGLFQQITTKYQLAFKEVRSQLGTVFTNPEVNNNVNKFFINMESKAIRSGISLTELTNTAGNLADNFGIAVSEGAALSYNIADGAKAIGVQATEMGGVVGNFQLVSDLTLEQAHNLSEQTAMLAAQNDVLPQQIMRDIAQSTEDMAKFSAGGVKNFIKAAIQARKLGMSVKDISNTMNGLLNFEDSLNKELQASIMLGKRINLNEARRAAFAGDTAGAIEAVAKELGGVDLKGLDPLTLQAVAGAANMSVTQLTKLNQGADEIIGKDIGESGMEAFNNNALKANESLTDMEVVMADMEAHMRVIANQHGEKFLNAIGGSAGFMKNILSGLSGVLDIFDTLMEDMSKAEMTTKVDGEDVLIDWSNEGKNLEKTYAGVMVKAGKMLAEGFLTAIMGAFGSDKTGEEVFADTHKYFTQIDGETYNIFQGLFVRLKMLFDSLFAEGGLLEGWADTDIGKSLFGEDFKTKISELTTTLRDIIDPDKMAERINEIQKKIKPIDFNLLIPDISLTQLKDRFVNAFHTAIKNFDLEILKAKIESLKIDLSKIIGFDLSTFVNNAVEDTAGGTPSFVEDYLFGNGEDGGNGENNTFKNRGGAPFRTEPLPTENMNEWAPSTFKLQSEQQMKTNQLLEENNRMLSRLLSDGINVQRA